jgi:hypothetical protein
VLLDLNGIGAAPTATPGSDFLFRINVLPGDVNRSGSVLADDFSGVKKRFFRSTADVGSGDTGYGAFHDVDGNGNILAFDFSEVKKRFFNQLPTPAPVQSFASVMASDTRLRIDSRATRELFAVEPILVRPLPAIAR